VAARFGEAVGGLITTFRNRELRRLQAAWSLSWVADWAYLVALGIFAYERSGPIGVGLAGVVRMAPAAVVAPFASLLGDRYRRVNILRVNEVVWTLALAGSALAFFARAPSAVVYVLAGFTGICSTIFRPTLAALLPWLSRTSEELIAANAALTTIESLGTLAGPLLGGVVVAAADPGTVFAVSAGASALAMGALALTRTDAEQLRGGRAEGKGALVREAFAGFGVLRSDHDAGLVVLLGGAQTLVRGALNVLIVVAALGVLHMGKSGVGVLTAAIGAGGFVGSLISMNLVGRRLALPIAIALVLWGLPIAAIGAVPRPVAALGFLALLGGGNAIFDVAVYTVLQRLVPDEFLSRVFGLLFGLAMGCVALGSILVPPLIDAVGIRATMIATGSFLPLLTVLTWRRLIAIDRRSPARTAELRVLRAVPIFASLSVAALEYLAKNMTILAVPASTVLIREGEAGDRFYVVDTGTFDVTRRGRQLSSEGPGGFFGEMALLRDIPRQATVTAREDSSVYVFERRDFIAAVTAHVMSERSARELVQARLAVNDMSDKEPAMEKDSEGLTSVRDATS